MSKKTIGYWVSIQGFEGGITLPEEYEKSSILYHQLKAIRKSSNPSPIADQKEFETRCGIGHSNIEDKEVIKRLTEKSWWSAEGYKEKLEEWKREDDKRKKIGNSNASLSKVSSNSMKDCERIRDEGNIGRYLHLLDLDQDISELEQEKKSKEKKLKKRNEETFSEGTKEIELESLRKSNDAKIEDGKVVIKQKQDQEIKKEVEKITIKSEKKLEILAQKVEGCKETIEKDVSFLKDEQEKAKKRSRIRVDLLRKLQESNMKFTFLSPGKDNFLNSQPERFLEEIKLMDNLVVIPTGKGGWCEITGEINKYEQEGKVEENVVIICVNINKEVNSDADEDVFKQTVESYVEMLKVIIMKADKKFGRIFLSIPPATKETFKYVAEITKLTNSDLGEKVTVINLMEIQKKMGERASKDEELVWKVQEAHLLKKFDDVGDGGLSSFAIRVLVSEVGACFSGEAGVESGTECLICGLTHEESKCPPEVVKQNQIQRGDGKRKKEEEVDRKNEKHIKLETKSRVQRNYTEECFKCLQDHETWKCWTRPSHRCQVCSDLGHDRMVHYARKKDKIEILRGMYAKDGKFELK